MTDKEMLYLLIAEDLCRYIERELDEEAYIVGGAVRSLMAGLPITDIDITTGGNLMELTSNPDMVVTDIGGGNWGSYKIHYREFDFDVTHLRGDEVYEDGKLVEMTETADTLSDSTRRDFGINAGYLRVEPPGKLVVHDPSNLFWKDLSEKVIEFVGYSQDRIVEDPLRMMRAFRIASQMGWVVGDKSYKAITEKSELIVQASAERVRKELDKILLTNRIKQAFYGMYNTGLLAHVLPELHYAMVVDQNKHHKETVGEHLLLTVCAIRKPNLLLRWAALLHDIAKPKTRAFNRKKKDYTFYNHEVQSAFDTKTILRRLKFSNKEIDYVFRVIINHMYYITDRTKLSTVRQFMHRAGHDVVRDILRLRIADRVGNLTKGGGITRHLKMLLRMIRRIEKEDSVIKVTDLKIKGSHLKKLGLEGKEIGDALSYLRDRCVRNPKHNTLTRLLKLVTARIGKAGQKTRDEE